MSHLEDHYVIHSAAALLVGSFDLQILLLTAKRFDVKIVTEVTNVELDVKLYYLMPCNSVNWTVKKVHTLKLAMTGLFVTIVHICRYFVLLILQFLLVFYDREYCFTFIIHL